MLIKVHKVIGGEPPTVREIFVDVSHNAGLTWCTYFHFQDQEEVDTWIATLENAEVVAIWPCDVPGYWSIPTGPAG